MAMKTADLGSKKITEKELIQVRKLYYQDAKEGNTEDQLNYAVMCLIGEGGTVNIGHGEYWLNISANKGNARAQAFLGQCYFEGQFFDKDINKGKYWLSVASTNNDNSARSYLESLAN